MSFRIFLLVFIFFSNLSFANQKSDWIDTDVILDFRTMHIWRGIATSYTPTFEPTFEVTKNKLTSGIWFAQSIDGEYTELDIYLAYRFRDFSLTIYDYYCPESIQQTNEIVNYDKHTTKHTIEVNFAYKGSSRVPLRILIATMIYGDDINAETNKNYYSTYFELGYTIPVEKNMLDVFIGINPFESYYAEQFGVVNAGLTVKRDVSLKNNWVIPVQASLITNPEAKSLFLNFGFSL